MSVIAQVPGVCGIGIFSPRLDVHGNSARGVLVAEALSKKLGLHVLKKSDQAVSSLQSTGSSMDEGEKFQAYDPTPALLANEPRVDDVVEMDADQRRRKFSLSSPSASKIKIYPGPPEDDDEDDDIFREDIA